MPVFGSLMGKMLFIIMDYSDLEVLKNDSRDMCAIMFGLAIFAFLTGLGQKLSFGVIGENVSFKIRQVLYQSIISKHLGWFDQRENAPGILTSSLSGDAQIINGMSTEGLASILEAISAVLTGITIGFFYSWRESLVCLSIAPFMAMSGYMNAKF